MKVLLADLKLFSTFILISIILLVLDSFSLLSLPKSLLQTIFLPIEYGVYKSGSTLGEKFSFITETKTAIQENKALKKQLADALSENAALNKELKENQAIQDQSSTLDPEKFGLILSKPIGFNRFLYIDKGINDGITNGSVVLYKDNFIGQVKSTSPKSSQVILVSDPDSKIAVFSQNKDGKARGILQGQFGSDMLMDKILHQEPIEIGDLVYSEGTEGKLFRGLVIGKVVQVFERENEVFKQAKIAPIFDPRDLDIVYIMGGS